jgi:hypothetical protein
MQMIFSFLFRALLIAAGLVFAAVLAFMVALMLLAWLLRAAWARLTGRSVNPFIVRMNPRQGFDTVFRRAGAESRTPRADATAGPRRAIADVADVTDVQPREPEH